MQSDNPDIKWALDLLAPDPSYEPNFLAKYFLEIPSLILGPSYVCYVNYTRGFHWFARPYYHVGLTAGLLSVSYLANQYMNKRWARRDAILRDYIIRHPEDFPPPERKKYGEVFTEWVPIR